MVSGLGLTRPSYEAIGLSRGLSARSTAQAAACSRMGTLTVCGGKKKKAEKRVEEGRKRLGDVIKELQDSSTFDRRVLQSRLEEIDTVLCGECVSSSSSSSSSEDECMEAGMLEVPQATEETSVGNVVPLPSKVKTETVLIREAPISAAELVRGLPEGAAVRVCQGKACSKRGSAGLMATLQEAGAPAMSMTACKCLDKCKVGPNVEVVADGSKQVVQVTSPELVPARV